MLDKVHKEIIKYPQAISKIVELLEKLDQNKRYCAKSSDDERLKALWWYRNDRRKRIWLCNLSNLVEKLKKFEERIHILPP
ncbi:MAG: hypothetical protein QF632_00940 [Candidatus Woesearchaeota archaeon]|jgi:hypothetical protein|nr:hypothetical protein [Candidatus Woesearchaeota archaeon]MDP7323307.1 hypothetical protein [Candidatus Woesearchaeota archaeon]MDP7457826.1 hypothetical protein [Candidatus Woesearchaeota archaeon]